MTLAHLLVPLAPLLLTPALLLRGTRRAAEALAPWTALPALAVALAGREEVSAYPWLLLGGRLGLDGTGRAFLLLGAVLWLAAGAYARSYLVRDSRRHVFTAFLQLAAAGYFALALAQDAVTFYLGFALMTFSAYGLVVHERGPESLRAGRVYIALAVVGEAALLAGLVVIAHAGGIGIGVAPAALAGAPARDLGVAALLLGFGVKAGVLPLHLWLPLAHPVAPTPASAVLSGAMIKAGLLGWLRFLPAGEAELAGWGGACIAIGLATAFYAVAVGVLQREPKTILAYSSVSQMGVLLTGVGVGLAQPDAWPLVAAALVFYALHHGLAKAALFLGVGVAGGVRAGGWTGRLVLVGLLIPAFALAGAPLTSGAVAKTALETQVDLLAWRWPEALLPVTAVGTALLLGRFVVLARPARGRDGGVALGTWLPWAVLTAAAGVSAWLLPPLLALEGVDPYVPSAAALAVGLWPVASATVLLLGARRLRRDAPSVPPGDVVVPLERLMARARGLVRAGLESAASASSPRRGARLERRLGRAGVAVARLEASLLALPTGGALVLLVSGLLLVVVLAGGGE